VLRVLGRLSEAQRETVLLVYGEGFSYREAADFLEIPIGTIMSRLAATRRRLSPLADDVRTLAPSGKGTDDV
jgi:RNA polymerase sigma-70 factor (ECF subfamily)